MSSFPAYSTSNTAGYIVFKVTVECLVFTIFNFKISKVSTGMLSGKWPLLHIINLRIGILLLLFIWISIITTGITTILIVEGPIRGIIRYFTHAFGVDRH
jgi:hypothetical protein